MVAQLLGCLDGPEVDHAPVGLRALGGALLEQGDEPIDHVFVDALIADIDRRLREQIDVILHHPGVQRVERTWRALRLVVDRVRVEENIELEILNCSRNDLEDDFADSAEISKSGLYKIVYTSGLGTLGGNPCGLICAEYEFSPNAVDLSLLRNCASVAAMAHAPFVANASPSLFGLDDFRDLPRVRSLPDMFVGPRYRQWRSLRELEDARYVGLCLPRVLLRSPYGGTRDALEIPYAETVTERHEDLLWGPASFVFAVRAAESFARFRWCVFIAGSRAGGMVDGLPRHDYTAMGGLQGRSPVECLVTSRLEHALAQQGFVSLVFDRASEGLMLHSAASIQRTPEDTGRAEDDALALGDRLGAQLPYVFLVSRLAHYLKRVQRESIGQWDDRAALQRALDQWLRRYVSDINEPHWETRARRPLRRAAVKVEAVEGQAGWYRCHLQIQPHLTHNSAAFTLSLVGRLDPPGSQGSRKQ